MSDLNVMTITGRLVKDAVKKSFPQSGISYAIFDVANNTGFGDYAKANYFKCQLIGRRADSLTQYLTKGQLVSISGELNKNDWTNKEGNLVKDWQLTVDKINLISTGKRPSSDGEFDFDGQDDALTARLKAEANARAANPFDTLQGDIPF